MHRIPACFLLTFLPILLSAQVHIIVDAIPVNTPPGDPIYIAGSFNGWNPGDTAYQLSADTSLQLYQVSLPAGSGTVEFKFTRGSWPQVEGTENGSFRPNRSFTYGNGDTLTLQILGWEDLGGGGNGNSTAASNVEILTDSFYMPQLNRYRRVWVYVPPDYDSSQRSYPVLYMHDGQNVFDAATSFAGEWEVDETLNGLHAQGDSGIIVVAVDNGGANRVNEYSPWIHPNYGGGQGDEYVDFLVQTLKPHIDSVYRTRPQREYTGIMGSSMGGLISTYAGIEHQEVFGKIGAFSPSYWFSSSSFAQVGQTGKEANMRIYQLAGSLEGGNIPGNMWRMEDSLIAAGFSSQEVISVEKADGQHSEWFWAREFEAAYLWLFRSGSPLSLGRQRLLEKLTIFPNPATASLQISYTLTQQADIGYQLNNALGQVLQDSSLGEIAPGEQNLMIDLTSLELAEGMYSIRLMIGEQVFTEKFLYQP